jgi:hypothetical protein
VASALRVRLGERADVFVAETPEVDDAIDLLEEFSERTRAERRPEHDWADDVPRPGHTDRAAHGPSLAVGGRGADRRGAPGGYASRPQILEHVRLEGKLPKELDLGGAQIGMRLLIEARGTDITLTPDEQSVYEAILRGGRLPGGGVRSIDPEPQDGG